MTDSTDIPYDSNYPFAVIQKDENGDLTVLVRKSSLRSAMQAASTEIWTSRCFEQDLYVVETTPDGGVEVFA